LGPEIQAIHCGASAQDEAVRLLDRAQSRYLEQGAPEKAARAVFWLIFHLRGMGQTARSAGWISRLRRMLEDHDPNDELSYLVSLGEGVAVMQARAPGEAMPMLEQAAAGARAVRDDDLFVLAGLGRGRCLVALGRTAEALATLDEIMVYVVAERVAPPVVGLAYCAVISLCMERFDINALANGRERSPDGATRNPD
jgi:hypothetical protein